MRHLDNCTCLGCESDRVDWVAADQVRRLTRLIRWLSLTYGTNVPIFHGEGKDELTATYLAAVAVVDDDVAFAVATDWANSRPTPSAPVDWGDQPAEHVLIDHKGNTVT